MCGYGDATNGWGGRGPERMRLALCLLGSLLFHLVVGFLPVVQIKGGGAVASNGGQSSISVLLRGGREIAFLQPSVQSINVGNAKSVQIDKEWGLGLPVDAGIGDREPEPVSDIEFSLDAPSVVGFMILRLLVDCQGDVVDSQVVYTNLPDVVRDAVVGGFVSARFRPGSKGGKPVDASVLLRVDVQ